MRTSREAYEEAKATIDEGIASLDAKLTLAGPNTATPAHDHDHEHEEHDHDHEHGEHDHDHDHADHDHADEHDHGEE